MKEFLDKYKMEGNVFEGEARLGSQRYHTGEGKFSICKAFPDDNFDLNFVLGTLARNAGYQVGEYTSDKSKSRFKYKITVEQKDE